MLPDADAEKAVNGFADVAHRLLRHFNRVRNQPGFVHRRNRAHFAVQRMQQPRHVRQFVMRKPVNHPFIGEIQRKLVEHFDARLGDALPNRTHGIKLVIRPIIARFERVRRHKLRFEHGVAAVVFGPIAVQNPPFFFHALMQNRPRHGRQNVKCRVFDFGLFQKFQRALENAFVVMIHAENHSGVNGDAVIMNPLDRVVIFVGVIDAFMHVV